MSFAQWFWFLEMEKITYFGVEILLSGPDSKKDPLVTQINKEPR